MVSGRLDRGGWDALWIDALFIMKVLTYCQAAIELIWFILNVSW